MTKQDEQKVGVTGRDEEWSGVLSVRTVQIVLSCLDLFCFVSNKDLSSKSCLAHQSDFLLRTQAWKFQLCEEILESLFDISLKSSAQCAAAAKKSPCNAGHYEVRYREQGRRHHFAAIQKLGVQLWPLHLKRNVVGFKRTQGQAAKIVKGMKQLPCEEKLTQDSSVRTAERRLHGGYERSL